MRDDGSTSGPRKFLKPYHHLNWEGYRKAAYSRYTLCSIGSCYKKSIHNIIESLYHIPIITGVESMIRSSRMFSFPKNSLVSSTSSILVLPSRFYIRSSCLLDRYLNSGSNRLNAASWLVSWKFLFLQCKVRKSASRKAINFSRIISLISFFFSKINPISRRSLLSLCLSKHYNLFSRCWIGSGARCFAYLKIFARFLRYAILWYRTVKKSNCPFQCDKLQVPYYICYVASIDVYYWIECLSWIFVFYFPTLQCFEAYLSKAIWMIVL